MSEIPNYRMGICCLACTHGEIYIAAYDGSNNTFWCSKHKELVSKSNICDDYEE